MTKQITTTARSLKRRLRKTAGFTLIELLMVCLMAGLLGAGILAIYEGMVRSFADTNHRIINQDDTRFAINEIGRYIRMAESSASNLSSFSDAINHATASELVFFADLDGDGVSDKCRYYLDGTTLRLASLAADDSTTPPSYPTAYTSDGIVIMKGVQNMSDPNSANRWIFKYYKMNPAYETNPIPANDTLIEVVNPTTAAQLRGIVAVDVKLAVNETPGLPKANVVLTTRVQIQAAL